MIPAPGSQRQADLFEVKASLVYIGSSRKANVIQQCYMAMLFEALS